MKKIIAAVFLSSSVAVALGVGIVTARQGLHLIGKIGPMTVAPTYTTTVMGSLTPSEVLAKLRAVNLKGTSVGGAAHFDANHLYVNEGDFMQLIGSMVDPRPAGGIFINSHGLVTVVHHAKANTIVTVDFLVTNPVLNSPPTIVSSVGSATPQSWTITAPTHVLVVAVAAADGNFYFNLSGKLGVAAIKGADVWDVSQ